MTSDIVSVEIGRSTWQGPAEDAPRRAGMARHPHWAVTVETGGEQIVRLETECYGGRELSAADEDAVRTAAQHLLAFIGDRSADMAECAAFSAGYEAGTRDLCASGQVRALDRHQIARVVWDAMAWAAARPAPEGAIPSYQEWGNSLGEVEARRAADRILAALTPAPQAATPTAQEAVPAGCLHGYCDAENCPACSQDVQDVAQEAVPTCFACEDNPKRPNIPCAVCGAHPPQPSETVAEATNHALDACRIIDAAALEGHDNTSDLILHLLEAVEPARAALRALKGGSNG